MSKNYHVIHKKCVCFFNVSRRKVLLFIEKTVYPTKMIYNCLKIQGEIQYLVVISRNNQLGIHPTHTHTLKLSLVLSYDDVCIYSNPPL